MPFVVLKLNIVVSHCVWVREVQQIGCSFVWRQNVPRAGEERCLVRTDMAADIRSLATAAEISTQLTSQELDTFVFQ